MLSKWLARSVAFVVLVAPSLAFADGPQESVMVHVDSDQPVELHSQLRVKGLKPSADWTVCEAPCDRLVETRPDEVFFVDGQTIPRSHAFPIERPGPIRVAVESGSMPRRIGGSAAIAIGGASMVTGVVLLTLSLLNHVDVVDGRVTAATTPPSSDQKPIVTTGGLFLGLGAAVTTVGIVLAATSGTHVAVERPRTGMTTPFSFSF